MRSAYSELRQWLGESRGTSRDEPFRLELFNADQLRQHAAELASWHHVSPQRGHNLLLPRLADNEHELLKVYGLVAAAVDQNRRIQPAAQWLLDNFYVISEQIRMARRHLPRRYSRELPALAAGHRTGYPRVYDIALELISHVDGRVDAQSLQGFLQAYQGVTPLKLGELWAVPIMLRLALIENLRRVSVSIAATRSDRDAADLWAQRLLETAQNNSADLILVLADMARASPPLSPPFVTEFTRQVQGRSPSLALAVSWLDQRLNEAGLSVEQSVQIESQQQAADQVSMGNSIASLRFLAAMDWREFVEETSRVEQILRGDPAGTYAAMTFTTRDRYRHAVERTARLGKLDEGQAARMAVELASAAAPGERTGHVGYYLIDQGLRQFQLSAGVPPSLTQRLASAVRRVRLGLFLGSIFALTAVLTAAAVLVARHDGFSGWRLRVLLVLPLIAASHLALAVVNWALTLIVKPRALPRMDFKGGIPAPHRTMVVVPCMLSRPEAITDMLEALEIRYLANPDPHLHFALLTDFCDAAQETTPQDEPLVRELTEGIAALTAKYAADRGDIFFVFHRPRRWNPRQRVWMGWERKRGKLAEFNAVLRGGDAGRFSLIVGPADVLAQVRYVITLDADTQLPRDSARSLVGTMAHPLNRPVFDPARGRVTQGYAILQPRVAVNPPSVTRSWFARLHAGDAWIDPYTQAASDVYQDVFDEGSFIGKGIYDVDAFAQALRGRLPENAILSHDLLEGCHARSALVSDVQLYEEHPWHYRAEAQRRHRWIRGDWQIVPWLFPRVPGENPPRVSNPLSGLSRWKIFDNLRRSLTTPAMTALLLCDWLLRLGPVGFWPLFIFGVLFVPPLLVLVQDLLRPRGELPLTIHARFALGKAAVLLSRAFLSLALLPYEALISLDAIGRTLLRRFVTRRRLLEWQTASESQHRAASSLWAFLEGMWPVQVLAAAAIIAVSRLRPLEIFAAWPLLCLWFISPLIAWRISQPSRRRIAALTNAQQAFLGGVARRTWRFFETFVCDQERWLPPDNYQEDARIAVASRTSPTNIGLSLLANLAAADLGYISVGQMLQRTQKTLATMQKMERYRGHFYNWTDTRTLQPLAPQYVSSVDSGNLAGHLWTLRGGLLELAQAPLLPPRLAGGLRDTADVLRQAARTAPRNTEILNQLDALRGGVIAEPTTLGQAYGRLQWAAVAAAQITGQTASLGDDDLHYWATALERSCRDHRDDLLHITPWLAQGAAPRELIEGPASGNLAELRDLLEDLDTQATLTHVAGLRQTAFPLLDAVLADPGTPPPAKAWLTELRRLMDEGIEHAAARLASINDLAQIARESADMDFTFLLDKGRQLFAIGYNVRDHRLDPSYYDLLASECRLASYVAIAHTQAPQEHWFALGRQLTGSGSTAALLSWSGSMFEYLMPLLVMPTHEGTLLDHTYRAVVTLQRRYAARRDVPWGVSESCYNATDADGVYQYRAFGVPGLGFKRGLAEDLVVAPYASALSLMIAPHAACENLQRLAAQGRIGAYGFYEAVDYTAARLPRGEPSVTIRNFMAHHQGMTLLAIDYALMDRPMQRRFTADPLLKAGQLLLHERLPRAAPVYPHALEAHGAQPTEPEVATILRTYKDPSTAPPEVHLLGNGRYHVMVSAAGGGYSRCNGTSVTRWHEDPTRDCWGMFCYLRDADSGDFWSTAWQPTRRVADHYEATFSQAKAEFRRRDFDIDAHTQIAVSPEDDIELRRVTLTNWSHRPRQIELTSYAEVVLAADAADAAHPAFSNLFVETEILADQGAILCMRRPRSTEESPPWMFHLITVAATDVSGPSFETDRSRFIGRGRTLADPAAMSAALWESQGAVLDPIVAIRRAVRLAPEEKAVLDIVTGIAPTREAALALVAKYRDPRLTERVFGLAWTHSQVIHQHMNITEADAQLYGRLAGAVLYADPQHRAPPSTLAKNRRGQSGLWAYGISGDWPIVLLRLGQESSGDLMRQVIQAYAYWRSHGLIVDLVVYSEDQGVYRQALHERVMSLIASVQQQAMVDKPGGIMVRRAEQMTDEDRVLLQSAARIVLSDSAGTLTEQWERRPRPEPAVPRLAARRRRRGEESVPPAAPPASSKRDLLFFNGLGGFSRDGREYVITVTRDSPTPAPWVNVIANPEFGTVVSESGSAYTWSENSHEFRLTPWHNDPVTDPAAEAIYLRDEETGQVWSPTPRPAPASAPYTVRHGWGYSVFECAHEGIRTELTVFVAIDAPVKFALLKMRNNSGRPRRLSATAYYELVLGDLRSKTHMHVVTEADPRSGAVLAHNPYSSEFAQRVVFADVNAVERTVTGDRSEFLGRTGSPADPAALARTRLSGRVGAGLDPCAALQVPFELGEGQEKQLVFLLGAGKTAEEARALPVRFRSIAAARQALDAVRDHWQRTLSAVSVQTPDPALDLLANGWLLYQVIASRYWGRSGFYQSGGAFGFRDQLQDAGALLHNEPQLLREHLLRAAAHQFGEGDVQHWWHPPQGRGVRSRCSDDFLWLPYIACRYVLGTLDTGVLDEKVNFLEGRPVAPHEEGYYDLPLRSEATGTLYEHCRRAIHNGLRFGAHGLPLMGSGDWNDGMNLVGAKGQGESVWLGFFLYDVLIQFAELSRRQGDGDFTRLCTTQAQTLRDNLARHAWDGAWFRRAYFDDASPLGSAQNQECQIDSLAQSWAVLSNGAEIQQARQAMQAVQDRLVHPDARVIQIFDPPFDKSSPYPGYIQGYVPGVRENGGQYTHAAVWSAMALAALGQRAQAWEALTMMNPIHHGATPQDVEVYRVEPYVLAGDVYYAAPHTGRGGWTWYTGSAGWMYRLVLESILGLTVHGEELHLAPCLPDGWKTYTIQYRWRQTPYHITVNIPQGQGGSVRRVTVDGAKRSDLTIPLVDDKKDHRVEVEVG